MGLRARWHEAGTAIDPPVKRKGSGDGNGRRSRLENRRQRRRRCAALRQGIINSRCTRLGRWIEGDSRDIQSRRIKRNKSQSRQAAFEAMTMRQFPLARFFAARRTIAQTDDANRASEPCMLRSLRPEEWACERLDQDRIGNEKPHDKASCLPPFLAAATPSRHKKPPALPQRSDHKGKRKAIAVKAPLQLSRQAKMHCRETRASSRLLYVRFWFIGLGPRATATGARSRRRNLMRFFLTIRGTSMRSLSRYLTRP
jgi:hypothetical protein